MKKNSFRIIGFLIGFSVGYFIFNDVQKMTLFTLFICWLIWALFFEPPSCAKWPAKLSMVNVKLIELEEKIDKLEEKFNFNPHDSESPYSDD